MKNNTKKCIYAAVNAVVIMVCIYMYQASEALDLGYIYTGPGIPVARGMILIFIAYRVIKVSEFLLFNKE